MAFNASLKTHVCTLHEFSPPLRTHDLKLSLPKARLGATELGFLGQSIYPAGLHPDTNKVRVMTDMPMPADISQLRSLLGELSHYPKNLPNLSKWICPFRPTEERRHVCLHQRHGNHCPCFAENAF